MNHRLVEDAPRFGFLLVALTDLECVSSQLRKSARRGSADLEEGVWADLFHSQGSCRISKGPMSYPDNLKIL